MGQLAMWAFLALVGGVSFLVYLRHLQGPGGETALVQEAAIA